MTKKQKKVLYRIIFSFVFLIALIIADIHNPFLQMLFLVPYIVIGGDILKKAFFGVINRQPFDECFLMAVATVGALVLREYSEAVFVMLFYQVGELFQSIAVGRSRKSVAELMDIRPDFANIKDDNGDLVKVDPYSVSVGDIIYVKPGEKIPLDGYIIEGSSVVDTVALTGESVPRRVATDDYVYSGFVNTSSLLSVRVDKEFETSTASRILELVENASSRKSESEKFISKFARYYTPIVCFLALGLSLLPPLFILLVTGNNQFGEWIYRALTFLVISCPCALVVSVPLSFFSGIGCGSKNGILIKGANFIETLSKVKVAVFDKTGTLTEGVFKVTDIYAENMSQDELLELVALAEVYSVHPISESLVNSCAKPLDKSRVSCFTEMSGLGVSANIDGIPMIAGNSKLMRQNNIDFKEHSGCETVVYVAYGGEYKGYILISDVIKRSSHKLVSSLKVCSVERCIMLTGDRKHIGERVAETLGMDGVYTDLLPDGKLALAEELMSSKKDNDKLMFVGDGINDAPVLARADVGVSMGGLGSDAAIEASDIVIMDDDPLKIVTALKIAKKCMSIVYFNIYFAIGVKILFLLLGALGFANMWFAVFADVGVMVLAVLNSVRALKI